MMRFLSLGECHRPPVHWLHGVVTPIHLSDEVDVRGGVSPGRRERELTCDEPDSTMSRQAFGN